MSYTIRGTTSTRPAEQLTAKRGSGRIQRWRAASLIVVHVLIVVHIVHWKIAGKTLAPLELNEVMYTLEFGIVTAGFLFMAGIALATMVFGRVFCSWGCHILALQDLCAWILGKFRIKPKAVRSRLLLWVPAVAALYMFVWPQAVRLYYGMALPQLHLRTDAQGWASFATENFWRNLPTPAIALLTFGVCGFLIVYVLGSRGFCTYGCPYGAVFRVADRIAPARIRLRGKGADCLACGACTAACTSHVRVHEELNRYGMVVNPACLRDMDCVSACPKGDVFYGLGLPPVLKTVRNDTPIRRTYDFDFWEEIVLGLIFLAVLFVFRGLYDRIPFLLSIGLGAIAAYWGVISLRLWRRPVLQVNRWQLKLNGRLTTVGRIFAVGMILSGLFTMHSAVVHYYAFQGHQVASQALGSTPLDESVSQRAIGYLSAAQRWGLIATTRIPKTLADLHYQVAGVCFKSARTREAEEYLREALFAVPEHFMAHYDLGALLLEKGQQAQAIEHLRRAIALKPDFAEGHYNLALAYWMSGAYDNARREIDMALQLNPEDEQTHRLHEVMKK